MVKSNKNKDLAKVNTVIQVILACKSKKIKDLGRKVDKVV